MLRHLQLLDGEMESVDMTPEELENILYLHTECDGCWIPYVRPDELFQKGEKLGEIQDCFGGVLPNVLCAARWCWAVYELSSVSKEK